jgi:hypothetical protein
VAIEQTEEIRVIRHNPSVGTNSMGVPTSIANKKLKRLKPQ